MKCLALFLLPVPFSVLFVVGFVVPFLVFVDVLPVPFAALFVVGFVVPFLGSFWIGEKVHFYKCTFYAKVHFWRPSRNTHQSALLCESPLEKEQVHIISRVHVHTGTSRTVEKVHS